MARRNKNGLTNNWQVFADAYVSDPNRNMAEAYKKAYPRCTNKKTAHTEASYLLKKPEIQQYIDRVTENANRRAEVTIERVLSEIANVAFLDPADVFDAEGALRSIHDMPPRVRRCIQSIKVREIQGPDNQVIGHAKEIKFWSKDKHLELLGRHLAMFTDNHNHRFDFKDMYRQLLELMQGPRVKEYQAQRLGDE